MMYRLKIIFVQKDRWQPVPLVHKMGIIASPVSVAMVVTLVAMLGNVTFNGGAS